jgi:VanZ family protein
MKQKHLATLAQAAAWFTVAGIAYATLTNVGFVYGLYYKLAPMMLQVDMRTYAHIEHFLAFAIFGAIFGIAYPGRTYLVLCVVIGGAGLLEFMQTLTPDRHGTLVDALEKMAGGLIGILLGKGVARLRASKKKRGQLRASESSIP